MTERAEAKGGHVPVLLEAVLHYLAPPAGGTIVDATAGAGGHTTAIAERIGPSGTIIALDRDPFLLAHSRERFAGQPIRCVHANFADLKAVLHHENVGLVDGVLADLGVASPQLDIPERGFSFRHEGPLDMRMDPTSGAPASRLVQQLSAEQLATIFWEYGEERFSRRIAAAIVDARRRQPIRTTFDLAEIVRGVVPRHHARGRGARRQPPIDPATRVFQALRIAVNGELEALAGLLRDLPATLKPGGRAVIISFHSLEDRQVKLAFKDRRLWDVLTKKPVPPEDAETDRNPRSRSAKLRAAVRTATKAE